MKLLKKIAALTLVTGIVIYGVFFYIDRYILSTNNIKISSKKVDTNVINTRMDINIPDSAESIKVSYDGSYVAYEDNQTLNIFDAKSGLKKELNLENEVSYYSWLPDRNRILIVESTGKNYNNTFKIVYFDADRCETGDVSDIDAFNATAEVKDLKVSTLTNSIYIKAVDSNNRAKIYYLNIMKKLKKVKTKAKSIGNIEVIPHKSNLVYEDSKDGKIYVTSKDKPIVINNSTFQSLLGMDGDDNVYIGEVQNDKIVRIYSGSMDIDIDNISWDAFELNLPADKSDIYVSEDGSIFINNALHNSLYEVKTKRTINYPGKLLQIIDGGVISVNNGKLTTTRLNNL